MSGEIESDSRALVVTEQPEPQGPSPGVVGVYTLYAIRDRASGRLLTLSGAISVNSDFVRDKAAHTLHLQVDRSLHVVDNPHLDPVFVCHSKRLVETLIGSRSTGHLVLDATVDALELVTLNATVAGPPAPLPDVLITPPPPVEARPWWRR